MNARDFTAWLDDKATPRQERKVFRRLGAQAEATKKQWKALQGLLRENLQPHALPHPDFINAQVAAAICHAESAAAPPPLKRWIWAGIGSLAAAALLTLAFLPGALQPGDDSQFVSKVLSASGADSRISVSTFQVPRGRGVVLWVEGAGFIRPEEKVR